MPLTPSSTPACTAGSDERRTKSLRLARREAAGGTGHTHAPPPLVPNGSPLACEHMAVQAMEKPTRSAYAAVVARKQASTIWKRGSSAQRLASGRERAGGRRAAASGRRRRRDAARRPGALPDGSTAVPAVQSGRSHLRRTLGRASPLPSASPGAPNCQEALLLVARRWGIAPDGARSSPLAAGARRRAAATSAGSRAGAGPLELMQPDAASRIATAITQQCSSAGR